MSHGYDPIAQYYDLLHGQRKETIQYVRHLIKTFHPQAKTILNLACGTGSIDKALAKKYIVTGMDISPEMVAVAEKKNKKVRYYTRDMTQLDIDESFDVVTCLYASLNHVIGFDVWAQFFQRVYQHLNPGGLFLFDVITETGMYNLILNSPLIIKRGKHVSIGEVTMNEDGEVTRWHARGFDKKRHSQTQVYETTVMQVAYDAERIQKALKAIFPHLLCDDPEQGKVNEQSELLFFIARK